MLVPREAFIGQVLADPEVVEPRQPLRLREPVVDPGAPFTSHVELPRYCLSIKSVS